MRCAAAGAVVATLLLAGCGSGSAPSSATTTSTSDPLTSTATATTAPMSTTSGTTPPATTSTTTTTAETGVSTTTDSPTTSPMTTSPSEVPDFTAAVDPIYEARKARMIATGSWNTNCSIAFDDLRLVRPSYWGFDHQSHTGELVLNKDAVDAVVAALRRLYDARVPIRKMVTVEAYGADDETSMRDDNTSAYNGRFVEGTTTCSQHAYGRAIDINPLENPMVKDGKVYPATAGAFVDRDQDVTGMIHPGDAVVAAFAAVGWSWGGDWHSLKDYQHFSANGR